MKLKPLHSVIIFALLALSAMFFSVSNYRKAQYAIIKDMNQALAETLRERQDQWITPDTIQSYRSHLSIDLLRQTSTLCYAETEERRRENLASRSMLLDKNHVLGYANCSVMDVLGMSNQRTPLSLTLMAMLWAIWSVYYLRRQSGEDALGTLCYSSSKDTFYNKKSAETIRFTPMQHQLMRMFLASRCHQLTKQEICDALWPKKPDASETLYTLIRRIKPIIEGNSNLSIESERGKAYRLIVK